MNNWKVIFATAVIFGAGVVTGGLLVNYAHNSRPKAVHKPAAANPVAHPPESAKPRPTEILNKAFLQRLDDDLRLAPEQHAAIQKIIGEGQSQIRKLIQDARLEIREVLTPEQRQQFDDLVKRPLRKPPLNTNSAPALPPAANAPATNAPAF